MAMYTAFFGIDNMIILPVEADNEDEAYEKARRMLETGEALDSLDDFEPVLSLDEVVEG